VKTRQLAGAAGQKTFVLVFDPGDRVMEGLLGFARERGLTAASFTAVGALQSAVLGYFEPDRRDYKRIPIDEQVEVLALTGNVAQTDEGPKVHAHVVLGKADGTAHGGHLIDATVRPTLEIVVVETPATLRRTSDPATGLALIDLD
jgi:predicted DNA-binding protein with PD1-like motif